jgi:hypothetical protein
MQSRTRVYACVSKFLDDLALLHCSMQEYISLHDSQHSPQMLTVAPAMIRTFMFG